LIHSFLSKQQLLSQSCKANSKLSISVSHACPAPHGTLWTVDRVHITPLALEDPLFGREKYARHNCKPSSSCASPFPLCQLHLKDDAACLPDAGVCDLKTIIDQPTWQAMYATMSPQVV